MEHQQKIVRLRRIERLLLILIIFATALVAWLIFFN